MQLTKTQNIHRPTQTTHHAVVET